MRKRSAWAVAAPSMLGGVLAAHDLAYRLTVPQPERAHLLSQTGHAWFRYLPLLLASALALVAVGLVRRALAPGGRPAAWPFAVLPPLAFLLQEQVERLCHDGSLRPALQTPVLAGVLIAVPFGLAAYLVARSLLAVADSAGRALQAAPPRFPSVAPPAAHPAFVPALAGVHPGVRPGRGPPHGR